MREATVRDFWPCLIFGLKVLGGNHGEDTEKDLIVFLWGNHKLRRQASGREGSSKCQ